MQLRRFRVSWLRAKSTRSHGSCAGVTTEQGAVLGWMLLGRCNSSNRLEKSLVKLSV